MPQKNNGSLPDSPESPTASEIWDQYWKSGKKETNLKNFGSIIVPILEKHTEPGQTVLDAGCGAGFFSKWFLDNECSVVSLDISQEALELTRKHNQAGSTAYIKDDITDPKLPKRSPARFDVIFSEGLFDLFQKDTQDIIFKNMRALLKPQGKIIAFVSNSKCPHSLFRSPCIPGNKGRSFAHADLKNLFTRNGCEIVQSGGVNALPFARSLDGLLGNFFGSSLYAVGTHLR